jgi:hypothetical protein
MKHSPPADEIYIGFDAEWVILYTLMPHGENRRRNILCYQFFLRDETTGEEYALLVPVYGGRRQSLRRLLSRLIQFARRDGVLFAIPRSLILCGHFTRADLTILSDFELFQHRLAGVRRTYVTVERPFVYQLDSPMGEFTVTIRVLDTMLLCANGSKLADVGEMIGIPKVELPAPYTKDRMDVLQASDPELFRRYAMTDAVIVVRFVIALRKVARERLGVNRPFATLGGLAVNYFLNVLKDLKMSKHSLFGRNEKGEMLPHARGMIMGDAPSAFHGGLNTVHAYGVSPLDHGVAVDFDLKAAYGTVMRMLRAPEWLTLRYTLDLDELAVVDEALVIASVEFEFPRSVKHPCLTVRAGSYGLIYPLRGVSFCTGAELVVARSLGAKLKVLSGWRVEWDTVSASPFHVFIDNQIELRGEAEARGDVIAAKTFKECTNSLFGKLAQGVTAYRPYDDDDDDDDALEKLVFDTKTGESKPLPPSAITCPPFAAFITGMCRAAMFEMLNSLPGNVTPWATTTDGSILHYPDASFTPDTSGPIAQAFLRSRAQMAPGPPQMWETKAIVDSVLVAKTRMNFTRRSGDHLIKGTPSPAILAHVGNRLPDPPEDEFEHSARWIAAFRTRTYETKFETTRLTNLIKQHNGHADLLDHKVEWRWNADPDLKYRPTNIRDYDGLFRADGVPWESKDEAVESREAFDSWRASNKRVVKTAADWFEFETWRKLRPTRRALHASTCSKTPLLARAMILAVVFALTPVRYKSYKTIAAFVASCGVPMSVTSVKYYKNRCRDSSSLLASVDHLTGADLAFAAAALARAPAVRPAIVGVLTEKAAAELEASLPAPTTPPSSGAVCAWCRKSAPWARTMLHKGAQLHPECIQAWEAARAAVGGAL